MTSNSQLGELNYSWNPITGCLHNCVYCVSGDTLILTSSLRWKAIREVKVGDEVIGFSEPNFGGRIYLTRARVISKVCRGRRRVYIVRGAGATVKSTEDHVWLAGGGAGSWKRTSWVWRCGRPIIKFLIDPKDQAEITEDYMRGYLASISRGLWNPLKQNRLKEEPKILNRIHSFLRSLKATAEVAELARAQKSGGEESNVGQYEGAIGTAGIYGSTDDYARGFLAGAYDLGGELSSTIKIYGDEEYNAQVEHYGRAIGLNFTRRDGYSVLVGGLRGSIRFLMSTQPATLNIEHVFRSPIEQVIVDEEVDVEDHCEEYVYDIATTSGTFIANGFLSHNCWARRYAKRLASANIEPYRTRGFSPTLVEERLRQRIPDGRFVFVSDMGDMWGDWVPREWIERVLRVVRSKPKTRFLFLTKNPKRYLEFKDKFSSNIVLGVTLETNRDYKLTRAPPPVERYEAMMRLDWGWKAVVIEPILDFDEEFIDWIYNIAPAIVYVGYDNYGNRLPEPKLAKTEILLEALRHVTDLRPKTIRRAWYET